jgi:hypothetical protein
VSKSKVATLSKPEKKLGNSILLILSDEILRVVDREVAELRSQRKENSGHSKAHIHEANQIAAQRGAPAARAYLTSKLDELLIAQPLKGRRPSRSSFVTHLLELGIEVYIKQKRPSTASPPNVSVRTNGSSTSVTLNR